MGHTFAGWFVVLCLFVASGKLAQAACTSSLHKQLAQIACTSSLHKQLAQVACTSSLHKQLAQVACTSSLHKQLAKVAYCCCFSMLPLARCQISVLYRLIAAHAPCLSCTLLSLYIPLTAPAPCQISVLYRLIAAYAPCLPCTAHCSGTLPNICNLPTNRCLCPLPSLYTVKSLPNAHCSCPLPSLYPVKSLPTAHCSGTPVAQQTPV
jgi:hypothetical protein